MDKAADAPAELSPKAAARAARAAEAAASAAAAPAEPVADGPPGMDPAMQRVRVDAPEGFSSLPYGYDTCASGVFDTQLGEGVLGLNQEHARVTQYLGAPGAALVSVCCGIGVHGERVARHVSEALVGATRKALKREGSGGEGGKGGKGTARKALTAAIGEVALGVEGGVAGEGVADSSGCVATAVLLEEQSFSVAWVGDARCVLAKAPNGGAAAKREMYSDVVELTEAHTPDRRSEQVRIFAKGGRCRRDLSSPKDGDWLVYAKGAKGAKGDKEGDEPLCRVTRCIGDARAREAGVRAEPSTARHTIDGRERYLLLASDGLWGIMEPHEAVGLVDEFLRYQKDPASEEARSALDMAPMDLRALDTAAQALSAEAQRRWLHREPEVGCPDLSIVIVHLAGEGSLGAGGTRQATLKGQPIVKVCDNTGSRAVYAHLKELAEFELKQMSRSVFDGGTRAPHQVPLSQRQEAAVAAYLGSGTGALQSVGMAAGGGGGFRLNGAMGMGGVSHDAVRGYMARTDGERRQDRPVRSAGGARGGAPAKPGAGVPPAGVVGATVVRSPSPLVAAHHPADSDLEAAIAASLSDQDALYAIASGSVGDAAAATPAAAVASSDQLVAGDVVMGLPVSGEGQQAAPPPPFDSFDTETKSAAVALFNGVPPDVVAKSRGIPPAEDTQLQQAFRAMLAPKSTEEIQQNTLRAAHAYLAIHRKPHTLNR